MSKLAYLVAVALLSSAPACDSPQPARPTWQGDARGADVAGPEADSGPGPAAGPRIAVDPPKDLRFDNVMPGDEATRTVTVRNAGSGVLQVTGLSLSGRHVSAFSFAVAGDSPPYRLAGGEPGSYVTVEVTYRATDVTNQYAELHIFSDDPERPEVVVGLRGRPRPYCLRLSTEVLDFRTAAFGREPAEREVRLEDCGREDIVVRSLALADGSSPDFRIGRPLRGLDDACVQDRAAACTGEASVWDLYGSSFVVEYAPQELGRDEGKVVVRTDAPGYRELEIDLVGRGTDVIPPVCLAEAGPYQGDLEVHPDWQHALRVPPCTGIRLSSAGSMDPDGTIVETNWSVVEQPEHSRVSRWLRYAGAFLDLAGRYLLELTVTDNHGAVSDPPCQVHAVAEPGGELLVQLIWDTPGDPDQTDEGWSMGSDVDLHLLHPRGQWLCEPHDCHYANPNPDWGEADDPTDDPLLDLDDSDGAGPEQITLPEPEEGAVYRIGVVHHDDHRHGESFARVFVYLYGELRLSAGPQRLQEPNELWDVATVTWPSGDITVVDETGPLPDDRPDCE